MGTPLKLLCALHGHCNLPKAIFATFAGVGWGEAGMSSIDVGFIQHIKDAMAEQLGLEDA